jgi:hypothetical protein
MPDKPFIHRQIALNAQQLTRPSPIKANGGKVRNMRLYQTWWTFVKNEFPSILYTPGKLEDWPVIRLQASLQSPNPIKKEKLIMHH